MNFVIACSALLLIAACAETGKPDGGEKKSVTDFTDKDLERLAQQWEDDEEVDDEDNYPPKPKPKPAFDPQKLQAAGKEGVEAMLKQSKKGQVLMVFAKIGDSPTKGETEELTARWEESLRNGGVLAQRYIVADDRAIFMLQDGSEAWKMKDFLTSQDGCVEVEIDQKKYPGKRPHRLLPKAKKTEL